MVTRLAPPRKGTRLLAGIRDRLTFANVVSVIALFVALGGTAWAAAKINSEDVADNSLKSVDLKDGKGVKDADVVPDSLSGAAIDEASLSQVPSAASSQNVQTLIFEEAAGPGGTPTVVATIGPYTLKADCVTAPTVLRLLAHGPAGTADYMYHHVTNDTGTYDHRSGFVQMPADTDTEIAANVGPAPGAKQRIAGTVMLKSGSTVVQVDFNGIADRDSGGFGEQCVLYGTATMGP